MPVMVSFTIKTDAATYHAMHREVLPSAKAAGLIFHSGREVDGGIAILNFWPNVEAWQSYMDAGVSQAMHDRQLELPDDLEIVPVLTADS